MRKAKDHIQVPRRYYRPTITTCPYCGAPLRRRCKLWHKSVLTLNGYVHIYSLGYSCSRSRCSQRQRIHRSAEAEQLSPKGISFSYELIVQIGWWRFWEHQTIDEIAAKLSAKQLSVSRRHLLNLIANFLALLCAAQPTKIKAQRAHFERHGLIISLDALQPEQGNDVLFIVREVTLDLTLVAATVYSSRADLISRQLLEPVKALGFRIRAVVSDADENIQRAVALSLPGTPHQACQVHCLREAGQAIFEADRAMKTDLKRAVRAHLRPMARRLSQSESVNPQRAVLRDYCDALRDALRSEGRPPFELAGLRLYDELQRLDSSVRRCQKKGGIRS